MAAETCTGRSEFSDIIHPEFVIDANKNRSGENDNILSCVWLNHLPCSSISLPYHCSSFFLVKSLAETTTTIFVEKSKNCWNIRSDFGKHSQLIKQGNPNVYLLNAKEDSTGGDFRGFDIIVGWISLHLRTIIVIKKSSSWWVRLEEVRVPSLTVRVVVYHSTDPHWMVNYILEVECKDPFHFKCVREDDLINKYQVTQ
jgi:hypothetical protein